MCVAPVVVIREVDPVCIVLVRIMYPNYQSIFKGMHVCVCVCDESKGEEGRFKEAVHMCLIAS